MTGQPGRISCESVMPVRASAICCTSAAGIVTGDIAPIRMKGVSTTAWLAAEYSNWDYRMLECPSSTPRPTRPWSSRRSS